MHDRRAGLGHVAPPGFRVKSVELDDAAGGQDHRGRRHRERVHVKQRQRRDQPFLALAQRAQTAFGDIAPPCVEKVEVAQQAALRLAAGARGVEQGALACIARLGGNRKIPVKHLPGDYQAGFAMAQDVLQLSCTVVGIDRHHARADRVEGEKVQQELGAVLEAQRDAVPGTVAARAVARGDVRHPVERRGVAQQQLFRQRPQEWLGAVRAGGLLERRKDRRHCADGKMPRVVRTTGGGHVEEDFCACAGVRARRARAGGGQHFGDPRVSGPPRTWIANSPLPASLAFFTNSRKLRGGPEAIGMMEQPGAVRSGVVDMVYSPCAFYAAVVPECDAVSASTVDGPTARENGGIELLNQIHQKRMGVVLLGWVDSGIRFTLWSTKEPKFDNGGHIDIKGFKVRGNPIYNAFLTNYLGAQVININSSELYTALERGTVDITAWTQIGLMDLNWDRYIRYRILPDFFETDLMIIMNQKKWSSLSAKTREILQRTAIEHESASLQSLQDLWKKEQAELAQRGIKTLAQSPDASKRFVAGARAASLARMKERTEKAGGMENYDRVVQLFTPG